MPFHLIGIAGGSCSGKSTLAKTLAQRCNGTVLSLDMYYRDLSDLSPDERACVNFDHPSAIDSELLENHIEALAFGYSVDVPAYDFVTHTRQGSSQRIVPEGMVIVEGIFSLHFAFLRETLDLSAFISGSHETLLERRVARDCAERGRQESDVVRQYDQNVRPMYDAFVLPTEKQADLVLDSRSAVETSAERLYQRFARRGEVRAYA